MEKIRRYDIDWIRVIVFDILILYHVGMFFVPWGWHIKNDIIVEWLRFPMLVVNQWRIPILFVVSGMGTRFALSFRSGRQYILERFIRLYIPLAVGMLIVIPPQVYIERLATEVTSSSFFGWYPQFFDGVYPSGNFSWHHLWFLPYLFLMSVVCTPLFLNLRKADNGILQWFKDKLERTPAWLLVLLVPLFFIEAFLEPIFPVTHRLIDDWYLISLNLFHFIYGFLFISLGEIFWKSIARIRVIALISGLVFFPCLLWSWYTFDSSALIPLFKILNMWSWIFAVLGFSAKYLNKESHLIKYRNQAVYPFYILHQTITIIIGYFLMEVSMHYSIKILIMVVGTFGGCWIVYEYVIRRISWLRPLFGLKRSTNNLTRN